MGLSLESEPIGKEEKKTRCQKLGRFEAVEFLGKGGFGAVWRVEDPLRPGADLALKILTHSESRGQKDFVGPAAQEFRLGAFVRHPVLLETLEAGYLPGAASQEGERVEAKPYILTPFFPGKPLLPPWKPPALKEVVKDLLSALHTLHSAGWRHGDIKPSNVLVDFPANGERPQVRLLDFGLAEELTRAAHRGPTAGTPLYLSPEVLQGRRPDSRADLYALGVLLYECLDGALRGSVGDHLLRTRQGSFYREVRQKKIAGPLGTLIERLLDPDPESRLQSGREGLLLLEERSMVPASEEMGSFRPAPLSVLPSFEAARPVGRASFLEALSGALESMTARRPRPALLAVEGARGLGKSRLLAEAVGNAFLSGVRSLTWPMLRALTRDLPRGEERPGLDMELPPEGGKDSVLERADFLLQLIIRQPTLVVVDDLDKLPREEKEVVRSLVEKLRTLRELPSRSRPPIHYPVLVASVSFTSSDDKRFRAIWKTFLDLPWTSRHTLLPWSDEEISSYLDRVLPPGRNLGPFEEVLRRDSEGNPARLRLSLQELARAGELRLYKDEWICDRPPVRGPVAIPGEWDRFLSEWRQAEKEAREVLGLCAVYPETEPGLGLDFVASALKKPLSRLEDALQSLKGAEILGRLITAARVVGSSTLTGASESSALRIDLDRLRRAWILREGGLEGRRRWRSLIAQASSAPPSLYERLRLETPPLPAVLEAAEGGGPLAEKILSYHSSCARFPPGERAISALRLGEKLLGGGNFHRGERFLRAAKALPVKEGDRSRLEILLGEAALAGGDPERAAMHFVAASQIQGLDEELRAKVLFGQAVACFRKGQLDDARSLAVEGGREFPDVPFFQNLLGNIAVLRKDNEAAEAAFLSALSLAQRRGRDREEASTRTNYGRLLLRLGRHREAAEVHRIAGEKFERAKLPASKALALANLGTALRRAGEYEKSLEAASQSLTLYRELGDDAGVAVSEANLGILARELGLPGQASRRFRAANEAAKRAGKQALTQLERNPLYLENRALLALDLGKWEEAGSLQREAEASYRPERQGLSSEGLLLKVRLLPKGGSQGIRELKSLLEERPWDERDAPLILEAACLEKKFKEPGLEELRPAIARAKGSLRSMPASPRVQLYQTLVRVEEGGPESTEAREFLRGRIDGLVERDARRLALMGLIRGTTGEEREGARRRLRKLLNEITFDLDPEDREAFQAREDIQEAMTLATTMDPLEPGTAKSAAILKEVFRFNLEILNEGNLEKLLKRIVDAAIELTGAERGVLALRAEGRLSLVAARQGGKDLVDPEVQISRTIVERTVTQGSSCITTDAREDVTLQSIASVEELGLRSVLCVPLRKKRRVFGALYLDNPFEHGVFDSADLELLESFSAQAVLAWTAARRRKQVLELLRKLRETNRRLNGELHLSRRDARRRALQREKRFEGMVGTSGAMRNVFQMIEVVAPTDIPVLITGESGTGKELVARAIYRESRRADRPFVAENCGAVPAGLLESTLFGHEKGAFTGADRDRPGLFEMANGGTLFLDEIAEMPLELQTRLLRVLQEGEVRPIGSRRVLNVDVRIIAATNHNVREAIERGKLREDLFYRLEGAEIQLPPLRERAEDIPLLVEHFLEAASGKEGKPKRVSAETMEKLTRYPWPGNARELENEVRRLSVLAPGEQIGPEFLSPQVREGIARRPRQESEGLEVRSLKEVERDMILQAMRTFEGHRGKVAEALGVSRSTLYLKLRDIGYVD